MMGAVMPSNLQGVRLRTRLHILLRGLPNRREILPRRLQVSGLQVLPQLIECLRQWIGAVCGADLGGWRTACLARARKILGKRCEILLRRAQIPGLQILRQLLEFIANLLKLGLAVLRAAQSRKDAA